MASTHLPYHRLAPRDFNPAASGLPSDQRATLAARRAFVVMKIAFAEAVCDLPGRHGLWLQEQVRQAEEPEDLFLLRGPVFNSLHGESVVARLVRQRLRNAINTVFPDSCPSTGFTPLDPPITL